MTGGSLSAEDTALLAAEAPGTQLQIGALCFFEAAPLLDRSGRVRTHALRSHVAARLAALPRFRQRVVPLLGGLTTPRWVDDPDFDLRRHVATTRLARPGGSVELRRFVDGLLSQPMDLQHPLWDLHVAHGGLVARSGDGAPVDAVAVIMRAHHVMADGLALHAAATLLLDTAPGPRAGGAPVPWSPSPPPGAAQLVAAAVADRTWRRTDAFVRLARELADPRSIVDNTRLLMEVLARLPRSAATLSGATGFTGAIGTDRSFAWTSLPMGDLLEIKRSRRVSLNDAVLAVVTGAVRRALVDAGSFDPTGREPRAIIPIGDPRTDLATLGNRFSITQVALPIAIDDPLERVDLLHRRMHPSQPSAARRLMPHLFSVADLVPPRLLGALIPNLLAHQPMVDLAISNIPGSREQLYLWDSRLLGMHPFINVVGNIGLIVGVLSYRDELGVGVTVAPGIAGDPAVFAGHLELAAHELVAAARDAPALSGEDGRP